MQYNTVRLRMSMPFDFDWDPNKDVANFAKHGIEFSDAITVFDDPYHFIKDSTRPEYGEVRFRAVGRVGKVIVTVIFTDRGESRRIISARRARTNERAEYYSRQAAS